MTEFEKQKQDIISDIEYLSDAHEWGPNEAYIFWGLLGKIRKLQPPSSDMRTPEEIKEEIIVTERIIRYVEDVYDEAHLRGCIEAFNWVLKKGEL